MNSKAIKRQLLAAIAMVLVSAIALSSSTYAWFANNNRVSAKGMSVQATAEGGIEIKAISGTQTITASNDWATVADAGMTVGTVLYPTSNNPTADNNVLTSNWYHASAESASASAAKDDTYAMLQSVDGKCTFVNGVASGNGVLSYTEGQTGALAAGAYYLATTYHVAYTGKAAKDLKVQGVTVSGVNNDNFDKSLRVAVVSGNTVALYAPSGYTSDVSYKVCTATTGTPITLAGGTMPGSANVTAHPTSTISSVIAQNVGTEKSPTTVNVYIWFEGEDSNHYTNNLGTNVDTLKVTVDFVATIE